MTPDEELALAIEAAHVLDSRIFQEAKRKVLDGLDAQMRTVAIADQTMHTRLIIARQCWAVLEGYLEQVRQTGKLAEFQIQENERKKRLGLF